MSAKMIQDLCETNGNTINSKIIFSNIFNVIQVQYKISYFLSVYQLFYVFFIYPSQQFLKNSFLMLSNFLIQI